MPEESNDLALVDNLVLIGSSHISKNSVDEVKDAIKKHNPVVVAIELDEMRYRSMLYDMKNKEKKRPVRIGLYNIARIGFAGFLFALIGSWVSKKLGNVVNMEPGSEMKEAILQAKKHNKKLALIDQDIETTLKRFTKFLTWKEKFRMVGDAFRGVFFPKQEIKKYGLHMIDLSKVPSEKVINKMISHVKDRYPNIYRVLIHERNVHMANRLQRILLTYPDDKIVAVVGAGHREGMMKILRGKLSKRSDVIYSYRFTVDQSSF